MAGNLLHPASEIPQGCGRHALAEDLLQPCPRGLAGGIQARNFNGLRGV